MRDADASTSPQLLADVLLGTSAASTVAWCPVNGLLAVGARQHAKLACVHLISPYCVEHKVSLAVPLQGPEDDLVCVIWSPAGCRRVLLTATRAGAVSAWSQQPPACSSQATDMPGSVFTVADWWCHSVGQLGPQQPPPPAAAAGQQPQQLASQEHLLSLQWLQPPSCWPYSNRVMQEQDFQAGSVPNMFAPAAPRRRPASSASVSTCSSTSDAAQPESSMFHWVQPGTLAFAAVLSSGKAVVGWATWAAQGHLRWHLAPSVALLPPPTAAGSGGQQLQQLGVLAADVTISASGVLVALATQQEPDRVQVMELAGNPLHHHCLSTALRSRRPALQVQALAACSMAAGTQPSSVLGLSWDPDSNGQRLAVLSCSTSTTDSGTAGNSSSSPGLVTLLNLAEQPQQPGAAAPAGPSYMLAAVTRAHVAHAPQRRQQQCVWLLDGLLVGQQLLDAQTLARLPVSLPQPAALGHLQEHASIGPQLQALAASPHRVAVAVLYCSQAAAGNGSSSSSSRLRLYSIPPVSKLAAGGAVLPTLAGRLVWSLLLQRHSWDLVQHVLHAAWQPQPAGSTGSATEAGAERLAQRVAQVLSLVDRKLSAQAAEVYTMYAVRWDVLKYAVVCSTPGSEAQAFSIDMRLRLLVPVLELHLAAAVREEEGRLAPPSQLLQVSSSQQTSNSAAVGSSQPQQLQQPSGSSVALAEYAMELVEFEVACVNTWLHRRVAAANNTASAAGDGTGSAAAAASASVKAVPCIRFMLDFKSNTKLAAAGGRATELAKLGRSARVYSLWKLLHKPFDGRTEQPQNWEDLLMDVVPGPFELHTLTQPRAFPTSLYNLKLPPEQVLRHLQTTAEWQQVPVLTDADIAARATRLGLLPAITLLAKAKYAQEAQLHLSFRQQLPVEALLGTAAPSAAAAAAPVDGTAGKRGLMSPAQLAAAKRRRWERQVRDAMGSPSCAACVGSSEVVDLVNMAWASPTALALHSVDGAVLGREVLLDAGAAGDARAARRLVAGITNNWAYSCPITGEAWLLQPSA